MTDDKVIVRRFTLEEVLEIVERPEPFSGCASRSNSDDWAGGSYGWAVEAARKGIPKQTAHLDQFKKVLASVRTSRRAVPRWDVSGSVVDVGRFMSGEPDSMIEVVRGQRPSPMVRIAVERSASSNVSTEDIRATGASVLAAIEAMRTAGIPAEIWATFTVAPSSWARSETKKVADWYTVQVLLQEAGRPINLDVLAFWVLSPAALRRICFAIEEHEPLEVRDYFGFKAGGGYGMPAQIKSIQKLLPAPENEFFDEMAPSRKDLALDWLKEVLGRRAGIQIRTEGTHESPYARR